jgi:hypothetical protein
LRAAYPRIGNPLECALCVGPEDFHL